MEILIHVTISKQLFIHFLSRNEMLEMVSLFKKMTTFIIIGFNILYLKSNENMKKDFNSFHGKHCKKDYTDFQTYTIIICMFLVYNFFNFKCYKYEYFSTVYLNIYISFIFSQCNYATYQLFFPM